MSQSRIPLQQVFRSGTKPASQSPEERKLSISSVESSENEQRGRSPPRLRQIQRTFTNTGFSGTVARMAQNAGRGTRTPQMLEYERQAEERAKEQEAMQEERERMMEAENKMQQEIERIAQEEYEMKQYYEAEALRHAEEIRAHKEEVRRYQARLREHERRIRDHEVSSEAFARVIAMPAKPGRDRQASFMTPGQGNGQNGVNGQNGP